MYKLRDEARSQAAARLGRITGSESSDKPAGDGVSEDYGNKAAGPSSSAAFKRGGAVHGDKPKMRLDKAPRGKKPVKAGGGAVSDRDMEYANKLQAASGNRGDIEMLRAASKLGMGRPGQNMGTDASARMNPAGAADGARPMRRYGTGSTGYVEPEFKKGGRVEGSKADMKEDRVLAKKAGMSPAQWEKSAADKKHDAPVKRATGGAVKAAKGKTNVNIIIAPQGGAAPEPAAMPIPVPVPAPGAMGMKPPMMPPPAASAPVGAGPAPDAPFPNAQPAIPPAALAAMAGAGPKPEMPMPMRKHGGRVHMEAGAGSGEGRLEKIAAYGSKQR